MKLRILCLALSILFASESAQAVKVSKAIGLGMDFGGDKLVDVVYTDGSRSDIEAGRGVIINGGLIIDLSQTQPHTFETQMTFGWKFTSTKQAANGEVSFYRWPVELLSFYRNTDKKFRVGAGITYQFGNELKGTKEAAAASTTFNNATGWIVEAGYFVGAENNLVFSVRHTAISYQPVNSTASVSAASTGFGMTYWVP